MPTQQQTLGNGMKFAIESVENGSKLDLHVRLQVPAERGWGAIGIGTKMQGSMIFLTYPSGDASNTTLSVRAGKGEFEPQPVQPQPCSQLEGSSSGSIFDTAWVCPGLGDDPRLKGNTASEWIYAGGPGQKIQSSSIDFQVPMHAPDGMGFYELDMTAATLSAPSQPNGVPLITAGGSSSGIVSEVITSPKEHLILAHAILLGGAFLVLFPLGAFLLRIKSTRLHWMTQAFASLVAIIGWIIAITMCATTTEFADFDENHQILGLVTVSLLFPQFLIGAISHGRFKSTGRGISWLSYPHIYLGRIIIILGMVTGILGFLLYGDNNGAIAYGVAAGVVLLGMVVMAIWDLTRRSKEPSHARSSKNIDMAEDRRDTP